MQLAGLSNELEKVSPFSLSGGQKRRVALAGILAMEPEYLILDEPGACMDAPGKKILFDLLHHLNKERGITIVLVSHNMDDVADHADRVLVMENGQLKMDGKTEEVFVRKDELTEMGLGVPQAVELYLNLKENDYCYHCGVKRTHSKLRRIFKSQPKPTFSFTTVSCECGHVNSKENLFCEMCGKKLVEDEEPPLKDLYSNFEYECDYPIFCFC